MTNHPNRNRRKDAPSVPDKIALWMLDRERGKQPSPEQIRKLRQWTKATQAEMAAALHRSLRWYEEMESGRQGMHPNDWFAMRVAACAIIDRGAADTNESGHETQAQTSQS